MWTALIAAIVEAILKVFTAPNAAKEARARGQAEQRAADAERDEADIGRAAAARNASDRRSAVPGELRAHDPFERD